MLVVQNARPQEQFGDAQIRLGSSNGAPVREGNSITLPDQNGAYLASLLSGKQFLFCTASQRTVWFGGMDESPFLTQLSIDAWYAYQQGGEERLFAFLKPPFISELERKIGWAAQRQGDIFYLDLGVQWAQFDCFSKLLEPAEMNVVRVAPHSIFGTRHKVKGEMRMVRTTHAKSDKTQIVHERFYATGILEAPDHTARTLTNVHLLEQAANLFDPQKAD